MLLKNQGRLDGVNTVSDGLKVREKNNAKPSKHSKREPRAKQGFGWGKFGDCTKLFLTGAVHRTAPIKISFCAVRRTAPIIND